VSEAALVWVTKEYVLILAAAWFLYGEEKLKGTYLAYDNVLPFTLLTSLC
jgi:hypothetical protein